MWFWSASMCCNVCWPGFSSSVVSVCPLAEMLVVVVGRNGRHVVGELGVDEHMVMAAVGLLRPRRYDLHALEPELDQNRARDGRAALRLNEKDLGACGRGRGAALWRLLPATPDKSGKGPTIELYIGISISSVYRGSV